VKSNQRLSSHEPHDVAKWSGVLVHQWLGVKELLVPRNTSTEIAHGQGAVRDCWKLGNWDPFNCGWCSTLSVNPPPCTASNRRGDTLS